jgi:N-acyl-D-amino-acid deacylase
MPLERAVHQMTGLAADRLALRDVGRIRAGAAADLVVVDLATVNDMSDYRDPERAPTGIRHVVVNGVPVVGPAASGTPHAGRVYRRTTGG